MRTASTVSLALLVTAGLAHATPRTIPYSGRLETNGTPAQGTFTVRFAIVRDTATSLACLEAATLVPNCGSWNEEHASVNVTAGQFAVQLGSVRPMANDLFRGTTAHVAVAVRGPADTAFFRLTGLQRLGASPYALVSEVGTPPVGTIMAWHKNHPGVPGLGTEGDWVECNGQLLSDAASPLNGTTLPNLNGEGRFLRGATTSGTMQDDQMQQHRHVDSGHTHVFRRPPYADAEFDLGSDGSIRATNGYARTFSEATSVGHANISGAVDLAGNATLRLGDENRPRNMGVVWIMRVK